MKLASVRIENLRCLEDQTVVLDDYTCLVGPNGAGKSTVLCALNVFFRESDNAPAGQNLTKLTAEDFHKKDTTKPIRITVTFTGLSAEAQKDFADYYRQEQLVITSEATFDEESKTAEVRQYGQRAVLASFKAWFAKAKEGAKAPELKAAYAELQKSHGDLPNATTKGDMESALRAYEEAHRDKCTLEPSGDNFYGFTNGTNLLAKYVQWVFVPAVKDAATEQTEAKNSALAKLLSRAVDAKANLKKPIEELRLRSSDEYRRIMKEHEASLDSVSKALQSKLAQWAHPSATVRLNWNHDDTAVKVADPVAGVRAGESGFEGELCRLGHGLQRSYIMALLQELAGADADGAPRLLLGCEEPELFQHPPQSRYLGEVLRKLSTKNAQVLICTHSPHFVVGDHFENIRVVRKAPGTSHAVVSHATWKEVSARLATATGKAEHKTQQGALATIHQALTTSISEMFFTPVLFLVEGAEDVAYITAYLALMERWDEWRRLGCHIVATDRKSNMIRPLCVAQALGIPTFVVFDADGNVTNATSRPKHEGDNRALLALCGRSEATPFPPTTVWGTNLAVWPTTLGALVIAELDAAAWRTAKDSVEAAFGQPGDLEKNPLFIAEVLTKCWEARARSASLQQLCERMIAFARAVGTTPAAATDSRRPEETTATA